MALTAAPTHQASAGLCSRGKAREGQPQLFLRVSRHCRLQPLGSLTGLTALKLQHCQGMRRSADLAPLSLLTGLSSLSMSGCSQTEGSGISSLAPLTSLR